MKTANLFSITAAVLVSATFAAVGCTSAPVGTLPDSTAAASKTTTSGDDDDSTSTPASSTAAATTTTTTTTPAASTAVTTTTTATATTTAATGITSAACTTCIGTNTQVKTYLTCDAACTDDTCDDNCWSQSGCAANETTCENTLNSCQTQCAPSTTTTTGTTGTTGTLSTADQACLSCIQQGSSQAATYAQCDFACNDDNCDDQCWSQSGCANNENTCESALDNCDQQCADAH